jgi:hypothetical protein
MHNLPFCFLLIQYNHYLLADSAFHPQVNDLPTYQLNKLFLGPRGHSNAHTQLALKVHSHLVLETSVESTNIHASHLGLKPTHH